MDSSSAPSIHSRLALLDSSSCRILRHSVGEVRFILSSVLFSSRLSLFLSHEEKKTTASRVQQRQRGISHATAADGREFDRGTLEQ